MIEYLNNFFFIFIHKKFIKSKLTNEKNTNEWFILDFKVLINFLLYEF